MSYTFHFYAHLYAVLFRILVLRLLNATTHLSTILTAYPLYSVVLCYHSTLFTTCYWWLLTVSPLSVFYFYWRWINLFCVIESCCCKLICPKFWVPLAKSTCPYLTGSNRVFQVNGTKPSESMFGAHDILPTYVLRRSSSIVRRPLVTLHARVIQCQCLQRLWNINQPGYR